MEMAPGGTVDIRHALELADGNRSQAAPMLSIDRVSLWRKLKKLGLDSK